MDILPLADKQQRKNNQRKNQQATSGGTTRPDENTKNTDNNLLTTEPILSGVQIGMMVDQLNQMKDTVGIIFKSRPTNLLTPHPTMVEVVDLKLDEILLELNMDDLVEIDKQLKEESIEKLSEFVCGSFLSLTV